MQGADGGERRRRTWSADQKQRIIAESFAPGASVAEVARRYGLNANMLFTWRRRERAVNDVGKTVNIVPGEGRGGYVDCDRHSSRPRWVGWRSCLSGASGSLSGGGRRDGAGPDRQGARAAMISIPSGARVWLVTGHTDMRKGFTVWRFYRPRNIEARPAFGHLFVFRGRRGSLIKCLWSDGQEICDFEHQCYHSDLAQPDRVTPPPVAQYPRARLPTPSQEPLCHLVTIREAPELPARIVEICALSPDQELAVRQGMAQPPVTMIDPPWWR